VCDADFKPIELLVLRPSRDLGKIAGAYEKYLPRYLKTLTRGLGAKETESPDFVSLLMFEPRYIAELIAIGRADDATWSFGSTPATTIAAREFLTL